MTCSDYTNPQATTLNSFDTHLIQIFFFSESHITFILFSYYLRKKGNFYIQKRNIYGAFRYIK